MADDIPKLKTKDEIRAEIYGFAQTNLKSVNNLNSGSATRDWVEVLVAVSYWIHVFLWKAIQMIFVVSAKGGWLDLHGNDIDRPRKLAAKAAGTVTFSRAGTSGNVPIPSGTQVQTAADSAGFRYVFETTASVVLANGDTEVDAPVEAVAAGSGYNVGEAKIVEIAVAIPGVDAVTNAADWLTSEGLDDETDDPLRARLLDAWRELSAGTTAEAYRLKALSVTGVVSAWVDDNQPRGQGSVDVYITGTAGIPTQGLLDAVTAALETIRPVNDDLDVLGPTAVPVNVTLDVVALPGQSYAELADEAEKIVRACFNEDGDLDPPVRPQEVGEDFVRNRVAKELLARLPALKDLTWTAPTGNVVMNAGQLATEGTIAVTASEAAQP